MKTKISLILRRSVIAASVIAAAAVLLTSCMKNKGDNTEIPAAGLMALNLAPDQQSVVVAHSSNLLTRVPLAYTNYTGGYQNIYIGARPVESFDYPSDKPLAS